MVLMSDVFVRCDACRGERFNPSTLRIQYRGQRISDVLNLTVGEAMPIFSAHPRIRRVLEILRNVGLEYLSLGQPASSLSGGESQRVKLARELAREGRGRTLYLLDEPSTGLHIRDLEPLMRVLRGLVEEGNTVVVVEHQPAFLEEVDWLLELGPDGGESGGHLLYAGIPRELSKVENSPTGMFFRKE
jgi:excinuclease ABC subunit A